MGESLQKIERDLPKSNLTEKIWDQIMDVQDNHYRVEQLINEALEEAYGGLNPKFSMDRTTRHLSRTTTSTRRRKNVERLGATRRILDMKEEMGIHAYMKKNNLCN